MSPNNSPDRTPSEKPAKEQNPNKAGSETENEADKTIREGRDNAEAKNVRGLSTAQIAAAVISTGLLSR